jgi:hypothetical protein
MRNFKIVSIQCGDGIQPLREIDETLFARGSDRVDGNSWEKTLVFADGV